MYLLQKTSGRLRIGALVPAVGLQLFVAGCISTNFQSPALNPYVGVTAGASRLELDVDSDDVTLADASDTAATILAGSYSSLGGWRLGGEVQLSDLGSAVLNSGDRVGYQTASAAVLASLFPHRSGFNAYVKAGIGALRNDAPANPAIDLVTDNTINLVTGIGAEYVFNSGIGIRLEYTGHDQDVQFGTLGVTYSFGAPRQRHIPPPIVQRNETPEQPVVVVRAPDRTEPVVDAQVPVPADTPVVRDLPVISPIPTESSTPSATPSQPPLPSGTSEVETDAGLIVTDPDSADFEIDVDVIETETEVEVEDPDSLPVVTPSPEARDASNELPVVVEIADDSDAIVVADIDADGISDQDDVCDDTLDGIPVSTTGCDRYNGLLNGAVFATGEVALNARIRTVLDDVVDDLERFPLLSLEVQLLAESASDQDKFLARRRTIEILRFFRARGIPNARLKTLVPTTSDAGLQNESIVFLRTLTAR